MPTAENSPPPFRLWTRRHTLLGLIAPAAVLCGAPSARGFDWKLIEHEGRDYVSAQDLQKFYEFPILKREGRHLWFRSQKLVMRWTTGTYDIYINNVKFCLSFPVLEKDARLFISRMDLSKLIHPIIKPSHIQNAVIFDTIVLDPGHGGHDPGAVGALGLEKTYALDTCFRLKRKLETLGYKIIMTRSTDVFVDRPRRVQIANATPKAIFVSVHYNAYTSSALGLETFALAPQGTANTDKALKSSDMIGRRGNERDSENIALATAVHANCLYKLRSVDRGVKRHRFDVLAGIQRPAILVEGGFVSNAIEGARIHKPEFREALADAIAGGIQNFRKALLAGVAARQSHRVPVRVTPSAKR
jgi:N-acetylmuramoyl-L-alanine amidase